MSITTPQNPPAHLGPPGLSREEHTILLLNRQGEEIRNLGRIEGIELYRGERTLSVPYSYRLYIAAVPQAFYVGNGRGPQLVEYDLTGQPRRVLHLPINRIPLTRAELSARLQSSVNENYAPDDRLSARRTQEAATSASGVDSLPAFVDLRSDRAGQLWLRMPERRAGDAGQWLVVNVQTNTAYRVHGHPGWIMADAAHGLIAAIRKDFAGAEAVGVFELRR